MSMDAAAIEALSERLSDDLDIPAGVHNGRGADADFLYGAAKAVDLDDIAHIILIFKQHEKAGDDVGNQTFRAKADDERDDADAGDNGVDVNAEKGQTPAEDHDGGDIASETG